MSEYITQFDKERQFEKVYAPDEVCQLIYKNCISPDGVTIIGTRDSIENFIDTLDESELASHGFYEWIKSAAIEWASTSLRMGRKKGLNHERESNN